MNSASSKGDIRSRSPKVVARASRFPRHAFRQALSYLSFSAQIPSLPAGRVDFPMSARRNQLHGYLTVGEQAAFAAYAADYELDITGLAGLLIVRELRLRRLANLVRRYPKRSSICGRPKVTAHLSRPTLLDEFARLSKAAGVTRSVAAAAVFRAELEEQWLSKALTLDSTRVNLADKRRRGRLGHRLGDQSSPRLVPP